MSFTQIVANSIEIILWDLDGTLIKTNQLYVDCRNGFFNYLQDIHNLDTALVESYFREYDSTSAKTHGFGHSRFGDSMVATAKQFGVAITPEVESHIRTEYGTAVFTRIADTYPGAINVLRGLQQAGYKQYIYTAGDSIVQQSRIDKGGFSSYIDDVIIVENKTSLKLAETLLEVGWSDVNTVCVGNSLRLDILPAFDNLIPAIWLDTESWEADQVLETLEGFPEHYITCKDPWEVGDWLGKYGKYKTLYYEAVS